MEPKIKKNRIIRCLSAVGLLGSVIIVVSGQYSNYYVMSLCMTVFALLFMLSSFENHRSSTGRMVLTSIMTALAVVGRFIPMLKPVTAITVLTGVYLGGEAGFLTGALTAFISNFYFGQGPWTPFQMLALGILGFLAGILGSFFKKNPPALIIYGLIGGVLYSFIMDVWTVLWAGEGFTKEAYFAALITAVPFTISYAISNGLFLILLRKPLGKKLDRIIIKYGL